MPFTITTRNDGRISYSCPKGYTPFGNLGSDGRQMFDIVSQRYICNPLDGKFLNGYSSALNTLACVQQPTNFERSCTIFLPPLRPYAIYDDQGDVKCPYDHVTKVNGVEVTKLNCKDRKFVATYPNGTIEVLTAYANKMECDWGYTTTTTTVPPSTTTLTTTSSSTTTTISPRCPSDGVWSEWVTTGACPTSCESYNTALRQRTCTTFCGNCPCKGTSEEVGPCGIALCSFPSKTCNAPYIKSLNGMTKFTLSAMCNMIYHGSIKKTNLQLVLGLRMCPIVIIGNIYIRCENCKGKMLQAIPF
ncbi:hypothetical protein PMAYCL1PPCAC_09021, partial [Pristionchus mayeri]